MKRFDSIHMALALACGVATGVAIGLHLPRWLHQPARTGEHAPRLVNRFSRQLGLSQEQKEKLAAVLAKSRRRMMDMRAAARPELEAIRAETAREIEEILTPEQVKAFREMEKRREARHPRPGRGGAGGGRGKAPRSGAT